jgi:hypothetical protein
VLEQQKKSAAVLDQNRRARETQMLMQQENLLAMSRGHAAIVLGAVIQGLFVGAIAFFAVYAAMRRYQLEDCGLQ